jgi:replicative DNA helicase
MIENVIRFPAQAREVPHNIEAEHGVLGAILAGNRAYERVGGFLRPDHFYDPVHGRIYAAAAAVIDRGGVADPVTLRGAFRDDPALAAVGGAGYLADLAASVVSVRNAEHYGRLVVDCAMRRELIEAGLDLIARASSASPDDAGAGARGVVEETESRLFGLAEDGAAGGGPRPVAEFVDAHVKNVYAAQDAPDGIVGLRTGLIDLDRELRGLKPGALVIIAGRPSMGKTALALNVAHQVAKDGGSPLFVSEEMPGEELAARLVADLTGIPVQEQFSRLTPEQFRQVEDARHQLSGSGLWIDDTPSLTIARLRTVARRHKRRHGLSALFVDYLQLLHGGGKHENRVQEISTISRGLKEIAKELHVPVIALSQLSRAVESREDKRPMLSDLRESGSIEQDADIVVFPYRAEYYVARQEPVRGANQRDEDFAEKRQQWINLLEEVSGTAEIIIAKFRQGSATSVKVAFDGARTKFSDLYRDR